MISTKKVKTTQISTTKRIVSASIVKPIVASGVILAIDRLYFKNLNLTSNMTRIVSILIIIHFYLLMKSL